MKTTETVMIADFLTEINEGPLEYEARVLTTVCFCVDYVVSMSFMNHESSNNLALQSSFPFTLEAPFLFTFQEPFKDEA
jgi:hypothetical protein